MGLLSLGRLSQFRILATEGFGEFPLLPQSVQRRQLAPALGDLNRVFLVEGKLAESALSKVVFGVTTTDVAALATASVLLLIAAIVACVPPAVRAMRVDPVEGLRAE